MALDATIGGTASDTYGTLAEADAYFAARETGNWNGSDGHKEMALRKAATFLNNVYRGKWKGQRLTRDQALDWPRAWVTDQDGYDVSHESIPRQVKWAQFEAAKLIANGTALETSLDRAVKQEQIGSLSVTYMDSASLQAQYPQVTNYLTGLILGGPNTFGSFGQSRTVRG